MANQHPVLTAAEVTRMRELRKQGLSSPAIGRIVGRSWFCVRVHTRDVIPHREPNPGSVDRLRRIERWYARINETMAEVRA